MKFFRSTFVMVLIVIAGLISAKQNRPTKISQKRPTKTPQSSTTNSLVGNKPASNEDFWKIFMGGLSEHLSEPEKKMSPEEASAIVSTMNKVSDAFNQNYSFTELDQLLFMSQLAVFLKDPKYQQLLKDFIQILKDNVASFPKEFSNIPMRLEQSIGNKNPDQFYLIYSTLEHYFRGSDIKPLVRIGQAGWFARIKNAIRSGARRAYDYLFQRKSTLHMNTIRFDEATGKYVTEEKVVEMGK